MAIACSYNVLNLERTRIPVLQDRVLFFDGLPTRTRHDPSVHEPAYRGTMNNLSSPQTERAAPLPKISETNPGSPQPPLQPEMTHNR